MLLPSGSLGDCRGTCNVVVQEQWCGLLITLSFHTMLPVVVLRLVQPPASFQAGILSWATDSKDHSGDPCSSSLPVSCPHTQG